MMQEVKCLACGHVAETDGHLGDAVYRCDVCGAVMHYGQRVVIEPDASDPAKPMAVVRMQTIDGETVIRIDARDPSFVVSVAKNLLSLVSS